MSHALMSRRMDRSTIPQSVIDQAPRTLAVVAVDTEAVVYLREVDFRLRTMSRNCAAEIGMATWDVDDVKVVVVALRLDHNDGMTFEHWLDISEPAGIRVLQCLAAQKTIDVVVVGESDTRFYRVSAEGVKVASQILKKIRSRRMWGADAFRRACTRVSQLYPSSGQMWLALKNFAI